MRSQLRVKFEGRGSKHRARKWRDEKWESTKYQLINHNTDNTNTQLNLIYHCHSARVCHPTSYPPRKAQ